MIKKNLAFILGILFLVSFVVAETTTNSLPEINYNVNSESGSTTLSSGNTEIITYPKGIIASDVQQSANGDVTFKLSNTGQGAKQGDSTKVKLGSSELDLPLFSEATITKKGDIFELNCDEKASLSAGGNTFKDVEASKFKLTDKGQILSADFMEKNPQPYTFKDLNGHEIYVSRKDGWGRTTFDAETATAWTNTDTLFKSSFKSSRDVFWNQEVLGNGGGTIILDRNGRMSYAEVWNGGTYSEDKIEVPDINGRLMDIKPTFSSDKTFRIITNVDQRVSNGLDDGEVFILGDTRYDLYGKIDIKTPHGFEYTAKDTSSGLTYQPTYDSAIIRGDGIIRSNGRQVSVANGKLGFSVVENVGGGDSLASIQYSDLEGQPRLVTLGNTNKNQPTLQTENVQIASTSSTTAQNQQIQVAQNSIWARLFK